MKTKQQFAIELEGGPLCGARRIMTAAFMRVLQVWRDEMHVYTRTDSLTARGRVIYRHAPRQSYGAKGGAK